LSECLSVSLPIRIPFPQKGYNKDKVKAED